MTFLSDLRNTAQRILEQLGTTAVLQKVATSYDLTNGGTVSETVTEHAVTCSPLMDETDRYGPLMSDHRVAGTLYVSTVGLSVAPTLGDRFVFQGRNFAIVQVFPMGAQGGIAAYRADLSEIGA